MFEERRQVTRPRLWSPVSVNFRAFSRQDYFGFIVKWAKSCILLKYSGISHTGAYTKVQATVESMIPILISPSSNATLNRIGVCMDGHLLGAIDTSVWSYRDFKLGSLLWYDWKYFKVVAKPFNLLNWFNTIWSGMISCCLKSLNLITSHINNAIKLPIAIVMS